MGVDPRPVFPPPLFFRHVIHPRFFSPARALSLVSLPLFLPIQAKTQVERAIERFAEQTQRSYDDQDDGWDDYSDDDAQGW